jgi:hypothetical protein
MSTIGKVIFWVVVVATFALMVFHSSKVEYRRGYNDALASIKPDTEYVDKPVYIEKPVPYEVKPAGKEMYPVGTVAELKRIIDSLSAVEPDTTFIYYPVQLETSLFRDEVDSTYEAQITGWHTTIDWIKVNQKTAYITVPVPEYKYPKFMLSPSVEAQIIPNAFFASANLELDFWKGRWQMGVKGGYGGGFVAGQPVHGVVATVNAKYNLIRK